MRKFIFLFFLTIGTSLQAQEKNATFLEKVQTIDGIIENLYASISGEAGEPRDWELLRYFFHPEAKLIPSGRNQNGDYVARYMTVEDYINTSGAWLIENGFYERELHRVKTEFGPITHVFSTYESFHSVKESTPFMRGINSIQLLNDGKRWWIINIFWTQETEANPIPSEYLPIKN